jgi:SAM-dependent methyltransferase
VCGSRLTALWATATDTEYGTTAERFAYFLCRGCDCISIDPLPADRLNEIYPPTYYSFASGGAHDPGFVFRVKEWLDLRSYRDVLRLLPTDRPRILDVGGGVGEVSSVLVRKGGAAGTLVVDPDETSIEAARSSGLDGFAGTIEEFQTDERFELVLMLNLIEHVADPVGILSKVSELVTADGLIWIQTPNFRALDGRLFRHRNWAGYHCPRHWAIFGEEGLRKALTSAGLEVVRFKRTQGGGFWAQSLIGLRRARLMRHGALPPADPSGDGQLPRPLVRYRAFAPLAALGTAFDLATRRFRQVSQVVVLARTARA